MNTKTDEISSRLVAVAWREKTGYERPFWMYTEFLPFAQNIRDCEELVRLSDAEAVIEKQAEQIKELGAMLSSFKADQEELILNEVNYCAVLKLAREALTGVIAAHRYEGGFPIEALAAINEVLKGE